MIISGLTIAIVLRTEGGPEIEAKQTENNQYS